MTMSKLKETLVRFGIAENLVGILSESGGDAAIHSGVVILNAGIIHRVGPSRLGVEVARDLAIAGHTVLRFDLSGIGESGSMDGENLESAVRSDIREAVDLVVRSGASRVTLIGLCSGADNAFVVAGDDPRITNLVLIDPTIHRTTGFALRRIATRLAAPSFWGEVVSGRFFRRRLRRGKKGAVTLPPGYYGLLSLDAESSKVQAARLTERGVRFLYILTSGVHRYCNSPRQIVESMPGSFNGNLRTEWRSESDHVLSRGIDRKWLQEVIRDWIAP
jgi:pimeloyl-ACP methyl ester carboxylesterase